jgi:arylsulfatase A-like enzyme
MQVPDYGRYAKESWPNPEKGFAAMVSRLDADVGKLMARLKETGADENTLVLFTSDNGPHQEGGHNSDFFDSNGKLRGIKRDLYEGGIRVPAVARWPGQIKPGTVSDHVWAFWDFLPTCAELAGVALPKSLDGVSIVPALTGRQQSRHDYLYWEFHERGFHQAVRMDDWKAVRFGLGKPLELYDLKTDIGEQQNIAAAHPEVVKRIEHILVQARTESEYWSARA